jgi:hypothetical protein
MGLALLNAVIFVNARRMICFEPELFLIHNKVRLHHNTPDM